MQQETATPESDSPPEMKTVGLLAEYDTPQALMAACEQVRDAGYQKFDAYTPFPLHGIDDAMGIKRTILPWIVAAFGTTGLCTAIGLQWYANAQPDALPGLPPGYMFNISAKPYWSFPANIPVTFELTILFSALSTFFGMLVLNGLPRLYKPVFRSERFRKVTTDGFFISIAADDPQYDAQQSGQLLSESGATQVEELSEPDEPVKLPQLVYYVGLVLICLALIPPFAILRMRASTGDQPRIHMFLDMDQQGKGLAQEATNLFADGRMMRPRIEGTVARGELSLSDGFYRGYLPDTPELAALQISFQDEPTTDEPTSAEPASGQPAEPEVKPEPKTEQPEDSAEPSEGEPAGPQRNWLTDFPAELEINSDLMARGRQRFNIYCGVCHGLGGEGNGLVHERAKISTDSSWRPPTNLHQEYVRKQPVGQLFHTVSNGVRKMPGYRYQITPEDRWAIVLYVRALQRSRHATEGDVPPAELEKLPAE